MHVIPYHFARALFDCKYCTSPDRSGNSIMFLSFGFVDQRVELYSLLIVGNLNTHGSFAESNKVKLSPRSVS